MILRALVTALCLPLAATSIAASDLVLTQPIDCALGTDCFIQNYVDRDPGPGARDFACGRLTYDGHKGTDFALHDHARLDADIGVLAAAPGRVSRIRNDAADWTVAPFAPDALAGRFCGNGVVIDHGGGWESQYCHLERGSIIVSPGSQVQAGQRIGTVGLSGRTEFPHVHFSVRHDGQVVDPFAPLAPTGCDRTATTPETLWSDQIGYRATGLVNLGIADHLPDFDVVKRGLPTPTDRDARASALVVWAQIFGGQAGDQLQFELLGPDSTVVAQTFRLEKAQARVFRAAGKRLRAGAWPRGVYTGTVRLERGGKTVFTNQITTTLH